MAGPIEWLPPEDRPGALGDAPAPGPGDPEVVATGRPDTAAALVRQRVGDALRGAPVGVRVAAATLVAGVALAGYLSTTGSSRLSPPVRGGSDTGSGEVATSVLVAKARQQAALGDVIRPTAQPGECALVPPGRSPGVAAAAALGRALPTYRVRDVGRTIDQSTGLCVLDLRAVDSRGSVVLIEVTPPAGERRRPFPQVDVTVLSDGRNSSSVAATLSVDGWSVAVAAVGRLADQPAVADMLALTEDISLRW